MMRQMYLLLTALVVSVMSYAQTAAVQVIHNSPTPGTNSGPTVDIYVNGALLAPLTAVPFRAATPFLDVPAGVAIEVAVAPNPSTSVDDAIATFDLGILDAGATYVVIANGIVGDEDFPFGLFVNGLARTTAANPNNVEFAAFHGSPGAPAVDVAARTIGTLVPNLAYGEFTGTYLSVPPATYYLDVLPAGSSTIVATFEANLSGLAGGAATVFASGLLGNTPSFGLFAALPNGTVVPFPATEIARVQVIHNSPSPTVDIYANGARLLDDFEFRTATPFIFLPAGVAIDIAVAPGNSTSVDDAIVTFENIVFDNGKTYVVIANGIVGDEDFPFTLAVNDMGRETATQPNVVSFAAFHGSPGAPAVDVAARTIGTLVPNLAYGEFTAGYLSVPPATYYLDVLPAGSSTIVATFEANLSGLAGGAATVFASGLLGNTPSFGLFAALPDGTVVPFPATEIARVQVIHNSPSPTVDIYANGARLLDDFEFRTATPFIFLPAGVAIDIAVASGNSTSVDDAIVTFENIVFDNGKTYVVIANGVVGDEDFPFTLAVNDMGRETSNDTDNVLVSVFHGSPGAPAVDVSDFPGTPLLQNLAYGTFTPYTPLPTDDYFLEVRPNGSSDLVATFFADLNDLGGSAAVVVASGIVGGSPAFDLLAVLPDGTVATFTPIAAVQIIHNSPAAIAQTVDLWANNAIKIEDNLSFREATPFIFYPTRIRIDIGVAPANSQTPADILITIPNVVFQDGKEHIVVANGIPGDANFPFTLAVNTNGRIFSQDEDKVGISAFHGSPGAPAVNVGTIETGTLIEDLVFGEFSEYLEVDPGEYFLEVRVSQNEALVGTFGADVDGLEGFSAVVFASGLLGDQPGFGLFAALPNGTVIELDPFSRVQVIHNSPAPTVDIYANGALLLNDFAFRTATPFVYLPADTELDIAVAPGNSTSVADAIATFEGVVFDNGNSYVVMATGVVGNDATPFTLAVLENAREKAASGQGVDLVLYHGSPDAPAVDVTVQGGGILFNDIAYGTFSEYVNVPAASYALNVTPANDNSTIVVSYTADVSGVEGNAAVVFASGFLSGAQPNFGVWVALPDGTTFPLDELVSTGEISRIVSDMKIAPNPVYSEAQVRYSLSESLNVTLNIFDMNGRLLQTTYLGNQPMGEHTFRLDVSNLPQGIYNYSLLTPKGIMTQRFVVVK